MQHGLSTGVQAIINALYNLFYLSPNFMDESQNLVKFGREVGEQKEC